MPRGAKPKVYNATLVATVSELYASGRTQVEIAAATGTTQKIIWRLMRRHGLTARVAAKRDQRGAKNVMWRGDAARYAALHLRVATVRGSPSECFHCGTTDAPKFEWANLTGHYEDVSDYVRLCSSCHHKMDGHVNNLPKPKLTLEQAHDIRNRRANGERLSVLAAEYGVSDGTISLIALGRTRREEDGRRC